jgi:hypothetical protein
VNIKTTRTAEWWVAVYSDDEVSCWTELFADYEEAELHVRKICEKLWDPADGALDRTMCGRPSHRSRK